MATRRNIMQLNEEQLREALSGSTTTSAETPSQLVPWLAGYFRGLYGQKFFSCSADHQRKFTPLIYSMRPESVGLLSSAQRLSSEAS
jgi:hypothetical protein